MNSKRRKYLGIKEIILFFFIFSIGNLCEAATNLDVLKKIVHSKSSSKSEKHRCSRLIFDYYIQNQIDSAFVYSEFTIKNAESSGNTLFKIDAYIDRVKLESIKGDEIEGLNYGNKALVLAKKINHSKSLTKCYNALGIITYYISDYKQSLDYYYKSLTISEQIKDSIAIIKTQNNIAMLYDAKKDFDKAESIYLKCIEISKRMSNYRQLATFESNLGHIYLTKKQYIKAITYFNHALIYYSKENIKIYEAQALINVGDAYSRLKKYTVALEFMKKSSEIYKEIKDQKGVMSSYLSSARVFLDIGRDNDANEYLQKAWAIQKQLKDQELLQDCSELLYKYHKRNNNATKALHFYEIYSKIKDSTQSMEVEEKFHNHEIQYQLNKQHQADSLRFEKTRVIERMEKKSSDSRKTLTTSILLISLIALSFFGIVYYRLRESKNKAENNALLNQIQILKANLISNRLVKDDNLNHMNIEKQIDFKLNTTDWKIVDAIYYNPAITNKEIAEKVFVSYEAVRSSLKKMYKKLLIEKTSSNQKASLIIKLIELSKLESNS